MGKAAYIVFILPVVFTIVFSATVMAGALNELDRELNMLPFVSDQPTKSHNTDIEILGIKTQYTTSEPVQVQVQIKDESFDCGDLYITINSRTTNTVVTQSGFFSQCFESSDVLPIDDQFSEVITEAGSYELVVEMRDASQSNTISESERFTVR